MYDFLFTLNQTGDTDWIRFYTNRLQFQMDSVRSKYGDQEIWNLGQKVINKVHQWFEGLDIIKPSLLHGDLWSGNWSEESLTGDPVVYDPATYYGHSEGNLKLWLKLGVVLILIS